MRSLIIVSGTVQGVGFRPFVYRIARDNGLKGYVRNRGDACVEIVVQGEEEDVKRFLAELVAKKPPLASYDSMEVSYLEDSSEPVTFSIVESSSDRKIVGSVVPSDVSICNECLTELRDQGNRRRHYFFTTCTNCGPRFTMIEKLPYDRPNTTMIDFGMCNSCEFEYHDPSNRRFHAQTIACPECGPKISLLNNKGRTVDTDDPIGDAGSLLEDGSIVAVKGYGGYHIATSTLKSEPIGRLRKVKHRRSKPFAIMARDLEAARSFAEINEEEEKLLSCHIRPIVLLKKSKSYYLSDLISPGLHNLGVMLPYTALHLMLFDQAEEPAFVMTSANPPSEPIVKDDEEALKSLGSIVDYFLVHNRRIAHRCDDSVVRVNNGTRLIVRRSRGYAPSPVYFKRSFDICTLGLGAELMVTSCVSVGNRAFVSQHIGDIETVGAYELLREATAHLLGLVNVRPQFVACDLHPTLNTTLLARRMAYQLGCKVFQVQHHHAHIASLMAEHGIDEIIGISCDGVGYGEDGSIWGGEILECSASGYRRIGHLKEQPMVGGDMATYYPLRMVASILHNVCDVDDYLYSQAERFPGRKREVELFLSQLEGAKAPKTTSTGRILDAVAAVLGVCFERTFEGEPAMKLEGLAVHGKDILRLEPKLDHDFLDTTLLLQEIFEARRKHSPADLACSTQSYLARGLAALASDGASQAGIKTVGFSGGVAYNEQMATLIRKIVEERGLKFLVNNEVPAGDGGLSVGQVYAANLILSQ